MLGPLIFTLVAIISIPVTVSKTVYITTIFTFLVTRSIIFWRLRPLPLLPLPCKLLLRWLVGCCCVEGIFLLTLLPVLPLAIFACCPPCVIPAGYLLQRQCPSQPDNSHTSTWKLWAPCQRPPAAAGICSPLRTDPPAGWMHCPMPMPDITAATCADTLIAGWISRY